MSSCQHPFQEILACDRAPSFWHDRSTVWAKSRLPGWWPTWHRHSPAKIDLNSVQIDDQHLGLADYKVPQAKQIETANIARHYNDLLMFDRSEFLAFVLQDNDSTAWDVSDFLDQGIQDTDVHIRWANPLASVATLERIQLLEEDAGKKTTWHEECTYRSVGLSH